MLLVIRRLPTETRQQLPQLTTPSASLTAAMDAMFLVRDELQAISCQCHDSQQAASWMRFSALTPC